MPNAPWEAGGLDYVNGYNKAINSNRQFDQDSQILDRRADSLYQSQPDADAQASRKMQMAALAQQYAAAQGNGPSAAAAQQQQMGGQAMLGALANRSMGAASSGLGAVAQQSAATRAGEMQQAMGAYGEGTGQLRGADLGYQQGAYNLANAQNSLNLQQAAQNQAYTQGLEQHQYDTGLALTRDRQARYAMWLKEQAAQDAKKRDIVSGMTSLALTAATMGAAAPIAGKVGDMAGEAAYDPNKKYQ